MIHHVIKKNTCFEIVLNILWCVLSLSLPLVVVRGCSWLFCGCSWLFVVGRGCSWLFVVVRGCSWLFVVARGCTWLHVVVRGSSCYVSWSFTLCNGWAATKGSTPTQIPTHTTRPHPTQPHPPHPTHPTPPQMPFPFTGRFHLLIWPWPGGARPW